MKRLMGALLAAGLGTSGCAAIFDIQDRPYDAPSDAAISDGADAQGAGHEASAAWDAMYPSEETTTLGGDAISANDTSPAFEGDAGDAFASGEGAMALDSPVDVETPREGSLANESGPAESGVIDSTRPCSSQLLPAHTTTASSVYGAATPDEGPAGLATDGILNTAWESQFNIDPQWLDIDFGAPVFFSEVDILWQACALDYTLEVSSDQTNWSTISTVADNKVTSRNAPTDWSQAVLHKGLSGSGRYLRVNGTARCETEYGYAIWEIRAYGSSTCQP
jgi:hypothetical protein